MNEDPIVEEVRRARETLFARFNYDMNAFVAYLQQRSAEAAQANRSVACLSPQRPAGWSPKATKAAG